MSTPDELKAKRDELNKKVKDLISSNKPVFDKITGINQKISELKNLRDEKNAKIKQLKQERDTLNKESNEIRKSLDEKKKQFEKVQKDAGISNVSYRALSLQAKKLDWYLQTEQISVKKDEELRKKLEGMESMLKAGKKVSDARKGMSADFARLRETRAKADEVHKEIVRLSEESETHHKELTALFDKVKELRAAAVPVSGELKEMKKEANKAHEDYITLVSDEKMKLRKEKETRKKEETMKKELTEKELKRKAESLFEEFLKGKKLNSDELVIMQKYAPRE